MRGERGNHTLQPTSLVHDAYLQLIQEELLAVLEECDWNKSEVGRRFGKAQRQVTRWMQYLGIEGGRRV